MEYIPEVGGCGHIITPYRWGELDINNMSEQEIKEANTQSNVFIAISLKVVDAMEDIVVAVEI